VIRTIHGLSVTSALLLAVAVSPATAQTQPPTGRALIVFNEIDTVVRDSHIDRAELERFLAAALKRRSETAGVGVVSPALFKSYLADLIDSILNAAAPHSAPQHTIEPDEVGKLEAVILPAPFGGTVADLLPKSEATPSAKPSVQDRLEKWVDIRQSFLDEQSIGKPAKLSLLNHARSDETGEDGKARRVYTLKASVVLDGFVEWKPATWVVVRPVVGYEAAIESSAPQKDMIAHRLGAATDFLADSTSLVSSHRIKVTGDYKTDRGYRAHVYGATVQYTINAPRLGIGRYLGGGAPVDIRWRPYVGLTYADVHSAADIEAYQKMSSFTHGFWRTAAEIRLSSHVKITPEFTLWRAEREDAAGLVDRWQQHHSLEWRWVLSESEGSERISLSLSSALGRKSPDFKKEKSFELALAFKL
jgi:hypothetical protein